MSSIRVSNSPAQNCLNLADHFALVLRSLSLTFGALKSMFGIRASNRHVLRLRTVGIKNYFD